MFLRAVVFKCVCGLVAIHRVRLYALFGVCVCLCVLCLCVLRLCVMCASL